MGFGRYMAGYQGALWALLYSDDGGLVGRTDYPERGMLLFLLTLVLVKLSLSWGQASWWSSGRVDRLRVGLADVRGGRERFAGGLGLQVAG